MRTRARGADSTAVDIPYLSTTYGIPEADVNTLIDSPTTELVKDFLDSLAAKGKEFDLLRAEKLKVDVELENTVRTSETKVKAQKAANTKQAKEIEESRTRLNDVESAREALSTELDQLRSSTTGSSAETQTLRQRIETLEASNRDALALVESKSSEKDAVAIELSEQHGKLLGLRREVGQLEERNQALESAASSQKFKEQNLQQELDLVKRNNTWHATELQTRSEEHAKFRKERNARIASLQREFEDSNANVETLKRTEQNLRQRLEELQNKADEAFARIASIEEEAARKEEGWKTELIQSKRLAELQAQSAATHRARLQDVQGQIDQIKEDAAEEIGRLQAEIETERADKEATEQKLADLEQKVERSEQYGASRPGTPMRNGSLAPATPGQVGSPLTVPGSTRKYANGMHLTNTQMAAKWYEMEQDLEAERRRTAKLSQAMDEMITEIENRGPELVELKGEQERLEEEVLSFSRLLDEANGTRDGAVKDAQHWHAEAEAKEREGDILRQQLRDLSAQIKILLVESSSRENGLGEMSAAERIEIERAARGEFDNEPVTNVAGLISQKLVLFRDVAELQERNAQLLRLTRELGEKYEGDDARKRAEESETYLLENDELKQQLERYKDELQATGTQIDSYMKERDMFRRMLQHRGQLAPDADMQSIFGQSIPPATPQRTGKEIVAQTPRSKTEEDLHKVLKEQQTFFDQFRNEAATDRKVLKDQVDTLGRDKSNLQSELAHWKSQKTLAEERLAMLQSNFNALRNENSEFQKRSQQLGENAAKQDLRIQQVAEELMEARSMSESLRNENANAKAEKELGKRIEARLIDDNKGLTDERSRLNKLVSDLQSLQNERELSESESRRRLQGRVESLESDLADAKKNLERQTEDSKNTSLRREYEESQSRTRIDDLVKSLGNAREELVAAKTTRDQLQARVDEMRIELRSAEERVSALQPRPTPRPESQQNGDQQPNGEDEELSVEQRLALEASDLRRDLELARNELEGLRQQVEQYKSIAQSTEEELANLNETSEQFKAEIDNVISEKDARIRELGQKVDDITAELTTTNNELSDLRTKADDTSHALGEQKASFESEMARLNDDAERHAEEKRLFQEDLRAQAEIAQQAQQSYEDELLKHAEAARSLQAVRKEYNELRTEVAGIKAESEAAKTNLEQGENSWNEQRETFEKELEEAKKRRLDVDEQNRLLHQQMENFSSELATLRSGRTMQTSEATGSVATPTDDSNMQEVVKYLRREKEIVDVQYELSVQESKRLHQQLEYANTQLEETRQKLAEERRESANKTASEGTTSKLLQTINELNLYRESSITLRNENRQTFEKLDEMRKELERALAEIDPLKGRVIELEGEIEGKDGELKLLQDDRDHWRERTQNIISKYDRVDPAELEDLKKKLEEVTAEKERLEAEQAPLRQQLDSVEQRVQRDDQENKAVFQAKLDNYTKQAKERDKSRKDQIKDLEAAAEATNTEKAQLAVEFEKTKAELEQTKVALQEARANASAAQAEVAEEGQIEEGETRGGNASLHARIAEAEATASERSNHAEALRSQVQTLQTRVQELEGQVASLQQQLGNALRTENGEIPSGSSVDPATLDKLKQDLIIAQQEVEILRASAASNTIESQSQPAGEKSVADQVADEVVKLRTEMDQQHKLAMEQMKQQHDQRVEKMLQQYRQKLKEEKTQDAQTREQLSAQHSVEIQNLKEAHEAAISSLKEAHQAECERLINEGKAAVEKAEAAVQIDTTSEGSATQSEFTGERMVEMIKSDSKVRNLFTNNLNKRVANETERLSKTIAEKDEEVAKLREALEAAKASDDAAGGATEGESAELRKKLEAAEEEKQAAIHQAQKAAEEEKQAAIHQAREVAEEEKQAAVRQATETIEKKIKVQLNQRDIAQARIAVVTKAVQETPEKPVKEVWDAASKARPAPKPPATTSAASAGSPAATPAAAVPATPSAQAQASPSTPHQAQTEEQAKIQQRQERFGIAPAALPAFQATGTFGQPSAHPAFGSFGQPSAPTTMATQAPQMGTFGQPIGPGAMTGGTGFSMQAPAFAPGGNAANFNVGTGPSALKGLGSGIPRGGIATGIPRGGAAILNRGGVNTGASIQGPAAAVQPNQRGGAQSSTGRGGSQIGRGGRGGGAQRGDGNANAGQKRSHEGNGVGGDGKRMRGGGPSGGA